MKLALGLLAGGLLLGADRSSPVLRYWIERTVGPISAPGRSSSGIARSIPS